MNRATLVEVVSRNSGVFDGFYGRRFAGFLVVVDPVSRRKQRYTIADGGHLLLANPQIQASRHRFRQVRKELRLENTVQKRIWLLRRTDSQREPVVLKIGTSDVFDGSEIYDTLGLYRHLIVDYCLNNDVYSFVCL